MLHNSLEREAINRYTELYNNLEEKIITAQRLGYVYEDCNSLTISILIHSLQNIHIFGNEQKSNIHSLINRFIL